MRPKPLDHAWTSNLDVALTARADAVFVRRYRPLHAVVGSACPVIVKPFKRRSI